MVLLAMRLGVQTFGSAAWQFSSSLLKKLAVIIINRSRNADR